MILSKGVVGNDITLNTKPGHHGIKHLRTYNYSTGCSQHNTDFAKTNQNEILRNRTNFFKDFRFAN